MGREETGVPRTPEAFGAELRRLRENAGVSLDDIVSETKIGIGVLRNLEEGRFSRLPERVFTRNFVRQFGEVVGFSPDTLAEWFDMAWERYSLSSGSHPAIALAEAPEPEPRRRLLTWWPVALGIVFVIAVLAVLLLRDKGGREEGAGQKGVPSFTPTMASSENASGSPSPTAPLVEASPTHHEDGVEPGGGPVVATVRVLPGNECWIRSRDEAGRLNQRLLTAGERVEIPVRRMVQLTLGNGGGVVINVGGKTYRAPGRAGEVVHLELRPDGIFPTRVASTGADD